MAELQFSLASAAPAPSVWDDRTVRNSSGPGSVATKSSVWIYVVLAAAIGGGVFFWQRASGAGGAGGKVSDNAAEKSTLPLETFVVNLEGGGERAYLRVGITLGLSHPLPRNQTEMDVPIARDAILSVLATAKADQLLTADGKERLKADILRSIAAHAPQLGVENVYFTEFLVQM